MITVDKHYHIRCTHYTTEISSPALFDRRRVVCMFMSFHWAPVGSWLPDISMECVLSLLKSIVKQLVIPSQWNVHTLVLYGACYHAHCLFAGCCVRKRDRFGNKMDWIAIIEFALGLLHTFHDVLTHYSATLCCHSAVPWYNHWLQFSKFTP